MGQPCILLQSRPWGRASAGRATGLERPLPAAHWRDLNGCQGVLAEDRRPHRSTEKTPCCKHGGALRPARQWLWQPGPRPQEALGSCSERFPCPLPGQTQAEPTCPVHTARAQEGTSCPRSSPSGSGLTCGCHNLSEPPATGLAGPCQPQERWWEPLRPCPEGHSPETGPEAAPVPGSCASASVLPGVLDSRSPGVSPEPPRRPGCLAAHHQVILNS